ncbi:MAG: phosphoribosyltransferase family protein [Acidilobaceae archaeon]
MEPGWRALTALLGVLAFDDIWNVSPMVRYGLLSLRHRGDSIYLLCYSDGAEVSCEEFKSLSKMSSRSYSVAVAGVLRSRQASSVYAMGEASGRRVAVIDSREYEDLEEGASAIASAMASDRLEKWLDLFEKPELADDLPSFIALTDRGDVIAYRDSLGLTPLALGGYGFDLAIVASESSAIDVLDGDVKRHLEPGESILVSRRLVKSWRTRARPVGLCLFELLYMARHDSIVDGVSVYEFRKALGARLADRMQQRERVDVVVGVPESATPYAIGLANALRKPYDIAFVPTKRVRSMLKSSPLHKLIAIHLKMNPIRSSIEGKRVAIVDDSMVTGATAKTVSQLLRLRIGAEEVHFLVASPPIVEKCPYSLMKFDKDSLVAANLTSSDIEDYLEVDSLTWLSLEDVRREAEARGIRVCDKCFGSVRER